MRGVSAGPGLDIASQRPEAGFVYKKQHFGSDFADCCEHATFLEPQGVGGQKSSKPYLSETDRPVLFLHAQVLGGWGVYLME